MGGGLFLAVYDRREDLGGGQRERQSGGIRRKQAVKGQKKNLGK